MSRKPKRPTLTTCKVKTVANPRAPWRVWYTVEGEGGLPRRVFKSFASEDAAWRWAEDKDREIGNHGIRYGDVPPEVRRAFDFFRDESATLAAAGATVPRFEELVANALATIRKGHQDREKMSVTVAEGVAAFLEYKKPRVGARQTASLTGRLGRFAESFGDRRVDSITTAEIEAWLGSLRTKKSGGAKNPPPIGATARNHYRGNLSAFFSFGTAPARGWAPRNPLDDSAPERVKAKEPEAYTVEDATRIMRTALTEIPELVPVLALGLFGGLRTSEAAPFDLGKLRDSAEEIRVTGKTGPRMVPVNDTLRAWIAAQPLRKGSAWNGTRFAMEAAMRRLFVAAGVKPIANGARHSFISYRTAQTRDVARVADECGNSPSIIKDHYRQLVTSADAERFFAIRPNEPATNVSSIQQSRTA